MLVEMNLDNIRKYFGWCYASGEIKIINEDIVPYVKNLKKWLKRPSAYNGEICNLFDFNYCLNDKEPKYPIDEILDENDVLFFDFETEEEAFYFKLKYC